MSVRSGGARDAGDGAPHLEVWLAPFCGALERERIEAGCLGRADVDAVPFGVAGDDDSEDGLGRMRDVLGQLIVSALA